MSVHDVHGDHPPLDAFPSEGLSPRRVESALEVLAEFSELAGDGDLREAIALVRDRLSTWRYGS